MFVKTSNGTFHRLVRHHFIPFDYPEHSITGESVHSVIGDFEHPDLEHYNFEHSHSEHSDFAHSENIEELVRQMSMQNMQFQQETRASIQSLTNQMGQLATQLNQQ